MNFAWWFSFQFCALVLDVTILTSCFFCCYSLRPSQQFYNHDGTFLWLKVNKKAKIRNRYNQAPHVTQDTTWESDKTQENFKYKRTKRSALSRQVKRPYNVWLKMEELDIWPKIQKWKEKIVTRKVLCKADVDMHHWVRRNGILFYLAWRKTAHDSFAKCWISLS